MSATNRGSEREPLDQYPTPHWCVERLFEILNIDTDDSDGRASRWLEPCAGSGEIIQAANNLFLENDIAKPDWYAVEIDGKYVPALTEVVEPSHIQIGDFRTLYNGRYAEKPYDFVITNPPYSIAMEILEQSFAVADVVCMLMRMNFIESETRNAWMKANPPDAYVLPNRPSFVKGGNDNCAYAWLCWPTTFTRKFGRLYVLDDTPLATRKYKEKR